eukprot:4702660-Prymnesium_polylepis.1
MPAARTVSGAQVVSRLSSRGDELNVVVQRILAALDAAAHKKCCLELTAALRGHGAWPAVPATAQASLASLKKQWRCSRTDIEGYAAAVHRQQRGAENPTTAADYERHFVSVVLARLVLEPVREPIELQCDSARRMGFDSGHAQRLEQD